MNCEKCQELLSDYLEGALGPADSAVLAKHMAVCLDCAEARDELKEIIDAAHDCREVLYSPPDSRAMWLRISNTIEGERALGRAASVSTPARTEGFWTRLLDRRWQLTLPQMASAVAAIAVGVSLLTVLAVQNIGGPAQTQSVATKAPARHADDEQYPHAYLRQQQARISYLQQRVEQRKASWSPRMRESFDRSLGVIDQAVVLSLDELKNNPHDEVSEEMLNSALRDKMELLREFSEQ